MNDFWGSELSGPSFQAFSASHLITLAVFAVGTLLLVLWFRRKKETRAVDRFRYFLAGLIAVSESSILVWSVSVGLFDWDIMLPLQLCDVAAILTVVILIGKFSVPFEVVYFWSLGGSLQAMITPVLRYPFPHFIYITFFLVHGSIVVSILYLIAAKGFRPTWKSILKTLVVTNIYAGIVSVINALLGTNYMFLARKPSAASLLDYLGPWPWYILSLEGVLLVLCVVLYLPFAVKDFLRKK